MILYLDTSALVKLYVNEPMSDRVRHAAGQATASCTQQIAYVEMRSALARILREKRISPQRLEEQKRWLHRDWNRMRVVTVSETLIRRAGNLAEQFALRAYDSVHLAAAEAVNGVCGRASFRFCAFDDRLNQAATELGMKLLL